MPDPTNDFKIPLWGDTVQLRGSAGYRDNILLSHTNRQGSAFWDSGGDIILYRLPTAGWAFNFVASGNDVRYFGGKVDSTEDFALAAAQGSRLFDEHWTATLGANYTYQDQVMDLSAISPGQTGVGRLLGHSFFERVAVKGDFGANWGEVEMADTRQLLAAPLDGFWQFGPKLTLGHRFGPRSELSLSYQFNDLRYDDEQATDRLGNVITNSALALATHSVQLTWRRVWGAAGRWHTTLTAGFAHAGDNGSGYFDYAQYSLAPKVEYRGTAWRASLSMRAAWYDFPVQTVPPADTDRRSKTAIGLNAHLERKLSKVVKVFLNGDVDGSYSNLSIDDYESSLVAVGAQVEF